MFFCSEGTVGHSFNMEIRDHENKKIERHELLHELLCSLIDNWAISLFQFVFFMGYQIFILPFSKCSEMQKCCLGKLQQLQCRKLVQLLPQLNNCQTLKFIHDLCCFIWMQDQFQKLINPTVVKDAMSKVNSQDQVTQQCIPSY